MFCKTVPVLSLTNIFKLLFSSLCPNLILGSGLSISNTVVGVFPIPSLLPDENITLLPVTSIEPLNL